MKVDDTVEVEIRGCTNEAGEKHDNKPDAEGTAAGDAMKRVEEPRLQLVRGCAFRHFHCDFSEGIQSGPGAQVMANRT